MQHAVPGLVEEERAFLEGKMCRPARVLPRPLAFSARLVREIAILLRAKERESHGLFHRYAAQDPMNGRDYEVFAMGHQRPPHTAPAILPRDGSIPVCGRTPITRPSCSACCESFRARLEIATPRIVVTGG